MDGEDDDGVPEDEGELANLPVASTDNLPASDNDDGFAAAA